MEALYDDYVIADGSIYINYKSSFRRDDRKSDSWVFHGSAVDLVCFAFDNKNEFVGTYLDVFDYLNDGRILRNYAFGLCTFRRAGTVLNR